MALSVSATTRPARSGETDGVDYRFIDDATFDRMIAAGEFLEWAEVYRGRRYGTPHAFVDERLAGGFDVLLEIDVQGAAQVRAHAPDARLLLLVPPSLSALETPIARAEARRTMTAIAERLAVAERELEQAGWFDHVVVNDDLDRATEEVAAIIEGSRTR